MDRRYNKRYNKDFSHLLERLEAFEDRLGVSLEGLYVSQEPSMGYLIVRGELHLREGTELAGNLRLVVTAYDSAGRVLEVKEQWIASNRFFALEAFSISIRAKAPPVAKIRIYPKAK